MIDKLESAIREVFENTELDAKSITISINKPNEDNVMTSSIRVEVNKRIYRYDSMIGWIAESKNGLVEFLIEEIKAMPNSIINSKKS